MVENFTRGDVFSCRLGLFEGEARLTFIQRLKVFSGIKIFPVS